MIISIEVPDSWDGADPAPAVAQIDSALAQLYALRERLLVIATAEAQAEALLSARRAALGALALEDAMRRAV